MDYILYQIFKTFFEYILKKHREKIDNPLMTFKITSGYCLKLLTPETMKLFGSTENIVTKDKNGENVPHLKDIRGE